MHLEESPPASTTGLLIIAAILIVLSMLFSAAESSFLSVNKLRIRFLRRKKVKSAIRVGKLLDKKDSLINTILIGNNIVNIALSAILTTIAIQLFGPAGVGVATLLTTVILLIFGEIAPKTLGSKHPEQIASFLSFFIIIIKFLFHPFVVTFTGISRFSAKLIGVKNTSKKETFSEEDIKTLMEVGEEEGIIESGEKTMMHRVFKFSDLEAKDIMSPRTSMVSIPITYKYKDILELAQKTKYSRFPVYQDDIDDIKGILYLKDILPYTESQTTFELKKIIKQPLFIPETKTMTSIQQTFLEKKQSIAIVLDEYSGTAGLLTMDDIFQEIFGSMRDEYDQRSTSDIVKIAQNQYMINGMTRLVDIQEQLAININSTNNETIGGWLSEKLDRIPEKNDSIHDLGWNFEIIATNQRRVIEVLLTKEEEKQ